MASRSMAHFSQGKTDNGASGTARAVVVHRDAKTGVDRGVATSPWGV